MALLGNGGILELSREWPEPMALASTAISYASTPQRISLGNANFWTGDRVVIACFTGVPFDYNGDGYADAPNGHGIYRGGYWLTGPSRAYYTGAETEQSPFYERFPAYLLTEDDKNLTTENGDQFFEFTGQDDGKYFYNREQDTGLAAQIDAYIHVDSLDRIRLFTDEISAHNLNTANELVPVRVKVDNLVVASYSNSASYLSALNSAASSIQPLTLPNDSQPLSSVITLPSELSITAGDPDQRGWLIQCELTEWAMDVDAANLDMTAIGETFGEHTKALVRGAGSLQFLVENTVREGEQTSMTLLRLVMLTERNAKASAKFYLYKDRTPLTPQVGATAYYSCDLLLTNSRINVRATELMTGSTDFVVTGEIGLRFS